MPPMLLDFSTSSVADWTSEHGARMAFVIALAAGANWALTRLVPPALAGAVLRASPRASETELRKRANTLSGVFVHTVQLLLLVIVTFVVLEELGYNVAPFLTGLGVGGIAIGLGAQTLVRDMISGIFILVENQYDRGDLIVVGNVQGWVEDVNLRRTVVRDADGTLFTIPNGEVKISGNLTRGYSGINMLVPVSAASDVDRAITLIDAAGQELAADEQLRELVVEPPRAVRIEGLTPQGVTVRVLGKTAPGAQFQVASALRRRIRHAFDEAKISLGDSPGPAPSAAPPGGAPPARPG